MLTETVLEILHFFSRPELEGLQMHSRFLRDIVDRNSTTLPLRFIHEIMSDYREVDVRLERGNFHVDKRFAVSELTQVNLGLLFDRVNNSFVERLEVSIAGADHARFICYLRDHATELQCHIKILEPLFRSRAYIDYALVDFIASRLTPQTLRVGMICVEHTAPALLFNHVSMRGLLGHVQFEEYDDMSAAMCVIPGLLDVDKLQTCGFYTGDNALPWVVRFANMFETTNRGVKVVQSVTIVSEHNDDLFSSTSGAFSPLGNPQSKIIPAPRSDFLQHFFCRYNITESTAELFVFKNTQLCKRLDIYKWTGSRPFDHYLLQITDM